VTFYAFAHFVCRVVFGSVWRMRVLDVERVPLTGPLIVACNHVSYLDPPALGAAMPRPVAYMAKQELFRIPVLGPVITGLNAFPVDRSRGDGAAIKRAVGVLRTGAALGIFPEGTRNKDGTVKPQSGVALLHYLTGAPILPAYVDGTGNAKRLARVSVVFGEPVRFATPGEKASREEMAKWTGEVMQRVFALRERLRAD
jgi:1-acyl-sn-glycerol-3-phosphate acyltransferase